MRVLHVITNLDQGGAETVLFRLVTATTPAIEHVVVSLMGDSYYGDRLRALGIQIYTLQSPRGRITVSGLLKLRRIVVETVPDVVQTWMYHADLIGGLVARWAGIRPVLWGIRCSSLASIKGNRSALLAARICALLSRWIPAAIVCCSERAAQAHQEIGYNHKLFAVIPNGYDLTRFAPNEVQRLRFRSTLGIAVDDVLLGMVARWHPQKDHENLLNAIVHLRALGVKFRCILVGSEMDSDNVALVASIHRLGVQDIVILGGPMEDIPTLMNALDVHLLSSAYGEAFPNVVAEAMACGTPCAVTDVGDSALILGDTSRVAPPRDPVALALSINRVLDSIRVHGRERIGRECRARIEEKYLLSRMVSAYATLWERTMASAS